MNYKKIYIDLILKAQSENRRKLSKDHENYIYYERHHFVPKCFGGDNSKENLVLLTAKEHFIAHKLLVEIYPENQQLIYALWMMSFCKTKERDYRVSSREYERNKILFSLSHSGENHPLFGRTGELAPMYKHTHTAEAIAKMILSRTGNVRSEESKKKQAATLKGKYVGELNANFGKVGELNHFFGKHHSEATLKILRRPKTQEHKDKISKTTTGRPSPKPEGFGAKISKALKGIPKSEEHNKHNSEAHKGKPAHNKNVPMKEEQKVKLRKPKSEQAKVNMRKPKSRSICPHCGIEGGSNNMQKYHFDNCKQNPNRKQN